MKKISITLLFVIVFSFLKLNLLQAQVNMQDSLALVSLYNSTNGPHWKRHSNWLTLAPVSKWKGVYLAEHRVIELHLYNNNLNGILPADVGSLIQLKKLFLDINKLSGSIPSALGNLNKLTALTLDHNQLSDTIPSALGNLNKLTGLNLGHNQLSGAIPSALGNLTNLTFLYLDFNQLSGSIPSELGNLDSLQYLYLDHNRLNNIPPEMGNLNKLLSLYLDHNQLSSIPPEIGNLSNLINLDLGNNQLKKFKPEPGDFKRLAYLYLDSNQLSGNIPPELGNIHNLNELILSKNQLTGNIPSELGSLTRLVYLYLNSNQLSGSIPSELGNLTHLRILHLDSNKLTGNIPPELGKPYYLSGLYLNHNKLSGRVTELNNNRLLFGVIHLEDNKFTFAGMLYLVRHHHSPVYSPQANIPIHKNGNTLSVYTGGSYQLTYDTFKWYKGKNLIATIIGDSIFSPIQSGYYSVTVTNSVATQLTLYSDTIYYNAPDNLIASKMNNNSSISLYPNPAKSFTTLSFNADGKYAITVTNVSGKILQTKTGIANKGINIIQLDVSKYASGVYLITIIDEENKKQTLRLNKNN
jgi:Leucine-rich repeat (LRR) protein